MDGHALCAGRHGPRVIVARAPGKHAQQAPAERCNEDAHVDEIGARGHVLGKLDLSLLPEVERPDELPEEPLVELPLVPLD